MPYRRRLRYHIGWIHVKQSSTSVDVSHHERRCDYANGQRQFAGDCKHPPVKDPLHKSWNCKMLNLSGKEKIICSAELRFYFAFRLFRAFLAISQLCRVFFSATVVCQAFFKQRQQKREHIYLHNPRSRRR